MNILNTIKNLVIAVLGLGVAFLLLGFVKSQKVESPTPLDNQSQEQPLEQNTSKFTSLKGIEIFLDNPVENQKVTSPLKITGKAPGNWFFEASAPVIITNWDGLIIGESYIQAQGEWMTTDYVSFEGTLEFTNTEYGDYGFIIFKKDNPSGEPQFDDAVEFKVMFK